VADLEFWFEFASTYSYPAASRLESVAQTVGVRVEWQPFLLGPVLHEGFNAYAGVTETPGPGPFGGLLPLKQPGNRYQYKLTDRGDLEEGFADADLIVENTYTTQRQHQGYLEPQTVMVDIDPTGRINVWASSKMPHSSKSGSAAINSAA